MNEHEPIDEPTSVDAPPGSGNGAAGNSAPVDIGTTSPTLPLSTFEEGANTNSARIGAAPVSTTPTARTEEMEQPEIDSETADLPGSRRGPLYALTFRNFRLYFVGQLISVAGTWMQMVAERWLIWDLTHSALWLGYVSGANAVPYVMFSIAGGNVADRYSRRNILIWTQSFAMLLAFVLAALVSATHPAIVGGGFALISGHPLVKAWHVAALSAIGGVVNAYNMPAQQAFVTDMVEREALSNAIALNSLRFNLARVIGPVLAGVVLAKTSSSMCFFLNGLSFIAVIISLTMMRLPGVTHRSSKGSNWAGLAYILKTPSTMRVVLLVGSASMFAWSASTLFPMLAAQFHGGVKAFSVMTSVNGVGAALGGVFLTILGDRIRRKQLVYGGNIVFCLALLGLSMAGSYYIALACLLGSGFAMIVFAISANIKVQEDAPDALRGRVMAIYSLVFQGLMPLGSLEIGYLAHHWNSAGLAIRADAVICLTLGLAMHTWSRREGAAAARVTAEANA